jgi:hypothetical protein
MNKNLVKLLQFFLVVVILYLIYKQYHVETVEGYPSQYDLVNLNQIKSNSPYLNPSKENGIYMPGTRPLSCWGDDFNYIACCHGTDAEKALCFPDGDKIYTEEACCSNSETIENLMDIANDNRDQGNVVVCLTGTQGDTLIPSMTSPDSDNVIQSCPDGSSTMDKKFIDINEARMIFGLWPCVGGDKDINIDGYGSHHIDCQNSDVESDVSCNNRDDVVSSDNYQSSGQECYISDGKAELDLTGYLQCTVFDGQSYTTLKEIRTYYDCFKNLNITEDGVNMDTQCINDLESLIDGDDNFYCHIKHGILATINDDDDNEYKELTEGLIEIDEDGSNRLANGHTLHRNSEYFIPNHQTIGILRNLFDINEKQYSEGRLPYEMDCDQDGNLNVVDEVTIKRIGRCQREGINMNIMLPEEGQTCQYGNDNILSENIIIKDEDDNVIGDYRSLDDPIDESCCEIYGMLHDSICHTISGYSFYPNILNGEYEIFKDSNENPVYCESGGHSWEGSVYPIYHLKYAAYCSEPNYNNKSDCISNNGEWIRGICSNGDYNDESDCISNNGVWTWHSPGICSNENYNNETECNQNSGIWHPVDNIFLQNSRFLHSSSGTPMNRLKISQAPNSITDHDNLVDMLEELCSNDTDQHTDDCNIEEIADGTCLELEDCTDNLNVDSCIRRLTKSRYLGPNDYIENPLFARNLFWRNNRNGQFVCGDESMDRNQSQSFYVDENCDEHSLKLLEQGPNEGDGDDGFICHLDTHGDNQWCSDNISNTR